MITIENNYECFVQLWLRLERTRQMFGMQYKRFCIRRVLFNTVVDEQQVYGLDMLPAPALHPRASREFLRALVAVKLGIGMRKVDLKALDRAYSAAFPHSTPLNVNKKKREPPRRGRKRCI